MDGLAYDLLHRPMGMQVTGLSTMLAFWDIHRGRRNAVRRLRPFVGLAGDASAAALWSDGFGLGLLATSITLAAHEAVGPLDADALGLLQSGAWAELTGLPPDLIGPRIAMLSLDEDPRFLSGCRAALDFAAARHAGAPAQDREPMAEGPLDERVAQVALIALWDRLVEAGRA